MSWVNVTCYLIFQEAKLNKGPLCSLTFVSKMKHARRLQSMEWRRATYRSQKSFLSPHHLLKAVAEPWWAGCVWERKAVQTEKTHALQQRWVTERVERDRTWTNKNWKKLSIVKKQSIKKTCLQPKETSSICTFGTTCGLGIERAPAACGVASACRKSCYICTEETALCFVHWEDILEGTSSCFIKHRGTQDGIFTAFCSNTGHQVGEITHPDHPPVELMVQNPEYLIYFTLQRWNQHTFGICL